MKHLTFLRFSLLFGITIIFLASSCDEGDDNPFGTVPVGAEAQAWIGAYDDLAPPVELSFNDGAEVSLELKFERPEITGVDCQIDGMTEQCLYRTITLKLNSPFEDTSYYLTMYTWPRNRLTMNYSDTGTLEPEIFRLDLETGELEVPQTAFRVERDNEYSHNGVSTEALIGTTVETESLFASLPPQRFVYTKRFGLVEWTDYSGNVFSISE